MRSPVYRQAHSKSCSHMMQTHKYSNANQDAKWKPPVLQAELDFLASHVSIDSALPHHPFCIKEKLVNMLE